MADLISQFQSIPVPQKSFKGQTVIITGSNTGLGFEAAKHITRLEASRVILAVRSPKKGDAAKSAIEKATGRQGVVEVWPLEMDNFSSIKEFAARCETLDRLDVVIANAGVLKTEFEESDGIEMTIKVNVIGTFLLALNLFPVMRRSSEHTGEIPRLVVTSSIRHKSAKFSERKETDIFKALNSKATSNMMDRYDTSKLLELMLVASINEAMEKGPNADKRIILNCVHPGLCKSELDRGLEGAFAAFYTVLKAVVARTTEAGSRTLVHAASAGEETRGKYLSECHVAKPDGLGQGKEGEAVARRVHAEMMKILEQIQPAVTKNI